MANRERRKILHIEDKAWKGNPKIGRNDPCYCGSGMKYKHCHGKQYDEFLTGKIREFNSKT
jgi:uncharacterized protein YchJ